MFSLQKNLLPKDNNSVVNEFLTKFYNNIKTGGWNLNLELYKNNNKCISIDNNLLSPYEYVCYLAKKNISKGTIENITSSWQLINIDTILISLSGIISFITFNNIINYKKIIFESFIISVKDGKILNHNIHLRD